MKRKYVSSIRKISIDSSVCFPTWLAVSLFFTSLPFSPRCQTQCCHHYSSPVIFLLTLCEPCALNDRVLLTFHLSDSHSCSPPHPGQSDPHPSLQIHLHHHQLCLDSRGPALISITVRILFYFDTHQSNH